VSDESESSESGSDDDEIVHFSWKEGMVLNHRYQLTALLGDGTFGRVVLARDRHDGGREVAVKIIRDVKRYMENAKIEADILADIRKADPAGKSGCSIMYETFVHEQRFFCLVLEPLGTSLYDFLKANNFKGFWMQDIQSIAEQAMQALAFLHGQLEMTHTDLKPENILFETTKQPIPSRFPRAGPDGSSGYVRPASNKIKLIDFGNATYAHEHHSSIINTRQYRGPEVLLGLGWDEVSDLWSIGCILMELYAGRQLFETHAEIEHMALIQRIIAPLPDSMLERASDEVRKRYLAKDSRTGRWRLPWPERSSSPSSERHVCSQLRLRDQTPPEHSALTDFCETLLMLDPGKRPHAVNTLRHPFFKQQYRD